MHRIICWTRGYQINTNFGHALCNLEKTIETKRPNLSANLKSSSLVSHCLANFDPLLSIKILTSPVV